MLPALVPPCAFAGNEKVRGELNSIEGADNRCRLNFVIENKSDGALESMKLDLVAFATDGSILRRLVAVMRPVRSAKTMLRKFASGADCRQICSILLNDVTACHPGQP